jgi:uncharacterized membrane protein HdeD (DUF308 family)
MCNKCIYDPTINRRNKRKVSIRQEIDNEWLLAINGLFSLLFGLILLRRPITGIEVLVLITSFYLRMAGTMQIVLGFKVRGWSSVLSEREAVANA